MSLQPNHRFLAVKASDAPANNTEQGLLELLTKGLTANAEVSYAYSIYVDEFKREVLEAFLLTGATDIQVFDALKVPEAVIAVYRPLFFDMTVFRDELDKEAYTQTYPKKPTPWGHDLKCCALTLGLDYLCYRFRRGPVAVDILAALNEMIATANFLSKAARMNPLDSNATKNAQTWMTAAVKSMESYVKVKPATEVKKDEFELVLKSIDESEAEDEPKIDKEDLVH